MRFCHYLSKETKLTFLSFFLLVFHEKHFPVRALLVKDTQKFQKKLEHEKCFFCCCCYFVIFAFLFFLVNIQKKNISYTKKYLNEFMTVHISLKSFLFFSTYFFVLVILFNTHASGSNVYQWEIACIKIKFFFLISPL